MAVASNLALLHVGGLKTTVTTAALLEALGGHGSGITKIHICRDIITRISLGHAYVTFESSEAAKNALETYNCSHLQGAPMRIAWPSPGAGQQRQWPHNLCIKPIDQSVTEENFKDYLKAFGESVVSHKFPMQNLKSRGYAYVMFSSQQAAENAITTINSTPLGGHKVVAEPYVPRREREKRIEENTPQTFTTIFIKNLDSDIDESLLRDMFSKYGPILIATTLRNKEGSAKKSAFVTFADHSAAEMAIADKSASSIEVCRALTKSEQLTRRQKEQRRGHESGIGVTSVYVKNVDKKMSSGDLQEMFAKYGEVVYAKVMDIGGLSQGWGFVLFRLREDAVKAVNDISAMSTGPNSLYAAITQKRWERMLDKFSSVAHKLKRIDPETKQLQLPWPSFYVPNVPACNIKFLEKEQESEAGGSPDGSTNGPPDGSTDGKIDRSPESRQSGGKGNAAPDSRRPKGTEPERGAKTDVEPAAAPSPAEGGRLLPQRVRIAVRCLGARFAEVSDLIVSMLLELSDDRLLHILERPRDFVEKVEECYTLVTGRGANGTSAKLYGRA